MPPSEIDFFLIWEIEKKNGKGGLGLWRIRKMQKMMMEYALTRAKLIDSRDGGNRARRR